MGSSGDLRTRGARARKTVFPSLAEMSDEDRDTKPNGAASNKKKSIALSGDKAISTSGYTCRGRVKQKAQKRVELIRIGERR